jgi:hypothetical protein
MNSPPTWSRALLATLLALLTTAAAVPPPTLFDVAWDERDDLFGDLLPEAQAAATVLGDRDIYHLQIEIADDLQHVRVEQEVLAIHRGAAPLAALRFHLYPNLLGADLALDGLWLDGAPLTPSYLPPEQRALHVALPAPLGPGEAAVVRLAFTLELPDDLGRTYGLLALRGDILSLAHAYAQRALPDEGELPLSTPQGDLVHAETAFYRVRVLAPAALTVATGGSEQSRSEADGVRTTTYVAGPVRDLYLSASYRFESSERRLGGTTVRGFWLPGDRQAAQKALEATLAALTLFNERYGAYPYRELDLVPIDFGALGIEFPGIVGLSTNLYRPDAPFGFLESVTVHEVAHQWFYGLVGNDQQREPWLDESLTQYATLDYFGQRYGSQGYQGYRMSLEQRWNRLGAGAIPIGGPVEAYAGTAYGAIIYGLGPLVLERLRDQVGAETFAALLRTYADTYRWEIADGAGFRRLAEGACSCDLGPFFARWIDQ